MSHFHCPLSGLLLAAACAMPALGQASRPAPHAQALRLLEQAAGNFAQGDLALANLQYAMAHRLDAEAAQAAPLARDLEQAAVLEEKCMREGVEAARARDVNVVRQAVACLRKLDRHSSAALEVILRYQAALADLGGAFPRVRWEEWKNASTEAMDSPRSSSPAASGQPK